MAAALAKATEVGQKISVTVCDADGHLVGHQRMDGVFTEASRGSIGKAVAAAEFGRPSGDNWNETMEHSRTSTVTGAGAPNIRTRGGLPIIRNGEVEGAIGVSGAGTNEQDEQ